MERGKKSSLNSLGNNLTSLLELLNLTPKIDGDKVEISESCISKREM